MQYRLTITGVKLGLHLLLSWVPRLVEGELCFEGDLVDLDEEDDDTNSILAERFTTGPVVERVNGVIVKTRRTGQAEP